MALCWARVGRICVASFTEKRQSGLSRCGDNFVQNMWHYVILVWQATAASATSTCEASVLLYLDYLDRRMHCVCVNVLVFLLQVDSCLGRIYFYMYVRQVCSSI